jgi:hypothetical protein
MKVIVAGSRTLPKDDVQRKDMECELTALRIEHSFDEVVSGGACGADKLGEEWSREWDIPVKRMPADWAKWGKAAGMIRNQKMAEYADACVVFWDGKSHGVKNMIQWALKYNLKLFVFTLSGD